MLKNHGRHRSARSLGMTGALGLAAALLGWAASPVAAQPVASTWPPPAEPERFQINVTAYGWMPSTHGDITVGPHTASGDQYFWNAKMLAGVMLLVDASYGRWHLILNEIYGYQRFEFDRPFGTLTQRTQMNLFEAAAGYDMVQYRFGTATVPAGRDRQRRLEAVAMPYVGMRMVWMRNEMEALGITSVSDNIYAVPIVGIRGRVDLSERWWMGGGGDVGGGGGDLLFTWSVYGNIGYRVHVFGRPASLQVGYRATGLEIAPNRSTQLSVNAILHGPQIGMTIPLN